MKLFLCSLGLNNKDELQRLCEKPLNQIKCGVIKNPMDLKDEEKRRFLYGLVDDNFQNFGINKIDIDLRQFIGRQDKLQELINTLDMLWITGGNVFYLRELIKKAHFERILTNAINNGLIYGGDSAGALIICPTLKYLDAVDDTSQLNEVLYDGLGVIDFIPLPHSDNEQFKPKVREIKSNLEKDGYKVITFGDKQSIIIEGEKITVVG